MTLEKLNEYIEKRLSELRQEHSEANFFDTFEIEPVIKELEAILALTSVVKSRTSQNLNIEE